MGLTGAGSIDGRTRLARALKQMRAEIARDMGFGAFEEMPVTRRGLADQFVRLQLAADLMWAGFLASGRPPDRWLEYANAVRRYGQALGLERVPKVIEPTLADIRERYGGQGGEAGMTETRAGIHAGCSTQGLARPCGFHASRRAFRARPRPHLELARQALQHGLLAMAPRNAHLTNSDVSAKFRKTSPLDNLRACSTDSPR